MEDSSKEQRPRCPCGFWGTQQTLGLCSKCYCEAQRKKNQSSSDSSKPPIGTSSKTALKSYHNQQGRNESGSASRMDSKHFPSHSTTDNLPSSLTPGERQLNAAPPATTSTTVDTQVTTTGTNTGPSHTSAQDNDLSNLPENGAPRPKPAQLIATSSESSLQSSSTSSDTNYDPESLSSTSSTSVVSMPLSPSASLPGLHSPVQEVDITVTLPNTVSSCDTSTASTSLSASCSGAKLPHTMKDIVTPQVSLVSSSTKNISVNCDGKDQARSGVTSKVLPTDRKESPTCEDNSSQSPLEKGVKRSRAEMEASSNESLPPPSPQKNKKRCFTCSCKLELAQRTIGRCRCDRVFCSLHRLPELHNCDFNHKEDGRREAREKMIKPTRHLGTSFRRDDNL